MSDLATLRADHEAAVGVRDRLDEMIRRGEHVPADELGRAGRAATELEQRVIVAEREALLKMDEPSYQRARVAAGFGTGRHTIG